MSVVRNETFGMWGTCRSTISHLSLLTSHKLAYVLYPYRGASGPQDHRAVLVAFIADLYVQTLTLLESSSLLMPPLQGNECAILNLPRQRKSILRRRFALHQGKTTFCLVSCSIYIGTFGRIKSFLHCPRSWLYLRVRAGKSSISFLDTPQAHTSITCRPQAVGKVSSAETLGTDSI